MFNSGLASLPVVFERPIESTDANGAPIRSWATIRSCFAQVENEQTIANESIQAPFGQNTRSMTLVCRNDVTVEINTRDRVKTSTWLGAITGMRYSANRAVIYVDVTTGASAG